MADIAIKSAEGEGSKFARRLLKRKTVACGLLILTIFVLLAVFAPVVAPYSPSKLSIVNRLKPPSGTFVFGT
ncbi:ABC transporter permease, partial [Rhizobium ruizarguesonis]